MRNKIDNADGCHEAQCWTVFTPAVVTGEVLIYSLCSTAASPNHSG